MSPLRFIGLTIANSPLKAVDSKDSSYLSKAISGIAIGLFTTVSLGYYAYYAHNYFKEKKINSMYNQLESAIQSKNIDIVNQLFQQMPDLEKSLKPNAPGGRTPLLLHIAVNNNDQAMVNILLQHNADINLDGRVGTPLDVAVRKGDLQMTKYLIEKGASVKGAHESFWPPLRIAIMDMKNNENRYELHPNMCKIVQLLLNNGANPNLEITPSLLAAFSSYSSKDASAEIQSQIKETMILMLEKGAKLSFPGDQSYLSEKNHEFIQNFEEFSV